MYFRGLKIVFLALYLILQVISSLGQDDGTRLEVLDPRYTLEWKLDVELETIEFSITAVTTGWVGLGLSYNGKMTGADIVVGGVTSDGHSYFQDYHGIGNARPEIDAEQNWELLHASEMGNVTTIRVKRLWDTCDDDDVFIDSGTVKIIWAFGDTDDIGYHGSFKGALAVNLLDPPHAPVNLTEVAYELKANYTLDGRNTAYWCSVHKRESLSKTHIIAFKPKLETSEALKYVHHFNVYACKAPAGETDEEFFKPWLNQAPEDCWDPESSKSVLGAYCSMSLYAWSFGGRLLTLPEDIGFPWGEDRTEYFFFETHINNPEYLSDITIETGVMFYDTDILRPKEAGLMALQYPTTVSLFIPPDTQNWTIAGHGSSFCTSQMVPPDGINLFNVNLHAHISAKKMMFRHFRNGTELPWIAQDVHYDFDYQENRPLRNAVTILPNDQITIECTFDSTWKQSPYPVIGGYPSTDEMCMVFAFYYPKIDNIKWWSSVYDKEKLLSRYGITNTTENKETYPDMDPYIIEPEQWRGQKVTSILNSTVAWNVEEKAALQQEIQFGAHRDQCLDFKSVPKADTAKHMDMKSRQGYREVQYPEIDHDYSLIRNCPPKF